jgi:hypothetical protein
MGIDLFPKSSIPQENWKRTLFLSHLVIITQNTILLNS